MGDSSQIYQALRRMQRPARLPFSAKQSRQTYCKLSILCNKCPICSISHFR